MSTEPVASQFRGTDSLPAFVESLSEPTWLGELRRRALERFKALAWPTREDEEWRRSDISMYDFDVYGYGRAGEESPELPAVDLGNYAGVLRFAGGRLVERSLDEDLEAKGVVFEGLSEAVNRDDETKNRLESVLRRSIEESDNRVQVWHYVSWLVGAYLYVPEFVEVDKPFLVETFESGSGVLASPQIVSWLEDGSQARLVHRAGCEDEAEILYNGAADCHVSAGARLSHVFIQSFNIDSSVFSNDSSHVDRDGRMDHFTVCFGGMFAKQRFDCTLDGPGADVSIDGVYFPYEDQHMDLRTVQHHNAPNTTSRTYYKGVAKDEAHAIYQGLIEVDYSATQTDAYLTNKNIVLNDGARTDSIPSLQINTDDVKCSHGSTTGKLDEQTIFYLGTRGYSRAEAQKIIIQGFFSDLIDRLPEFLREDLLAVVDSRITGED
jgi:Fe-S cluster assembly protein SufD